MWDFCGGRWVTGGPAVMRSSKGGCPTPLICMGEKMSIIKKIIKRIISKIGILFRIYEPLSYAKHRKLIENAGKNNDLKLHLACGPRLLNGWLNIDMEVGSGILTMKLPEGLRRFDDNSVRYIYASHILEHLDYPKAALDLVRECHRLLTPGGILRIVVPGIEKIIRAYAQDDQAFFAIQKETHPSRCTTKLEILMYALQQDGRHKYGYDFETLEKLLCQGGFRKIVESDHNKSRAEELRIDYRAKTDNQGRYLSLYVEAIK